MILSKVMSRTFETIIIFDITVRDYYPILLFFEIIIRDGCSTSLFEIMVRDYYSRLLFELIILKYYPTLSFEMIIRDYYSR